MEKNTKFGVLGSGAVGVTLANGLKKLGYSVEIGSRTGKKVDGWDNDTAAFADVAEAADIVVLAVKGTAAEEVVNLVKDQLAGKTVLDTTNPIADKPLEDGVLSYFTSLEESLLERLQTIAPEAKFVKALNSVGNAKMVNPSYAAGKPSMFICGNNQIAKDNVSKILDEFGWEVEDMGGVKSARAIEPLCMLWCIPGMLNNQWSHAFKLLK